MMIWLEDALAQLLRERSWAKDSIVLARAIALAYTNMLAGGGTTPPVTNVVSAAFAAVSTTHPGAVVPVEAAEVRRRLRRTPNSFLPLVLLRRGAGRLSYEIIPGADLVAESPGAATAVASSPSWKYDFQLESRLARALQGAKTPAGRARAILKVASVATSRT